jgi:hypothetical protein
MCGEGRLVVERFCSPAGAVGISAMVVVCMLEPDAGEVLHPCVRGWRDAKLPVRWSNSLSRAGATAG